MWTAKILNSSYANGILIVTIEYANGEQSFQTPIDVTGTINYMEYLSKKVQDKLDELIRTDAANAQVITGPFIPVTPTPDPTIEFLEAIASLRRIKEITDLGIDLSSSKIEPVETQPATSNPVVDAATLAQSLVTPDVIANL